MDNEKVNNNTKQEPNSSDAFKSTNIYASKANKKADYFAHVKPTTSDKLRAKLKSLNRPENRKRNIIVGLLIVLILVILSVVIWLIIWQSTSTPETTTTETTAETLTRITESAEQLWQEDSEESQTKAVEQFNEVIEDAIESEDAEAATEAVSARTEFLVDKDETAQAIALYNDLDLSNFSDEQVANISLEALDLCNETGDTECADRWNEVYQNILNNLTGVGG